jgi:hypothetical protein
MVSTTYGAKIWRSLIFFLISTLIAFALSAPSTADLFDSTTKAPFFFNLHPAIFPDMGRKDIEDKSLST